MKSESSEVRSTLRRDPVAWTFLIFMVVGTLLHLLPVLSGEQLRVFAGYVFSPGVSIFVIIAVVYRFAQIESRQERRFWVLVAACAAVWQVVDYITLAVMGGPWENLGYRVTDLLFLIFYVLLFIAIITRPHRKKDLEAGSSLWNLEVTATIILIYGLITYFIVIPRGLTPEAYESWIPSYLLFVVLDSLLLARFAYLYWECDSPRWRRIYGLFIIAAALWILDDWAEILMIQMVLPEVEAGSPLYFLWELPYAVVVLAAISKNHPSVEQDSARDETPEDESGGAPAAPIAAYILVMPLFHFAFSAIGALDPENRVAREICVLCVLAALAIVAWLHQRALERQRDEAVRSLQASRDDLEL